MRQLFLFSRNFITFGKDFTNTTMKGDQTINYSNIFVTWLVKQQCKCSYKVAEHTLIYVHSGEIEINERGSITLLSAGECAFLRRDNRVALTKRCLEDGTQYRSIALSFPRKFLMDFYHNMDKSTLPADAKRDRRSLMKIPARPDVVSLFESIAPFYDSPDGPDEQFIRMKLNEGLYVLLKSDKNVYASLFDFTEPWKIDILSFLDENYMYDLSLDDIAHYTGRSLATFKRDFKKISDLTPLKWIKAKRLEVAHEKLSTKQERVQDVMLDVGFSNISYFSRIFKETYGCSPTEVYAS